MIHFGATPLVAWARIVASGLRPKLARLISAHHDQRRSGIVHAGSVAGGHGAAIFLERWLERAQRFQ